MAKKQAAKGHPGFLRRGRYYFKDGVTYVLVRSYRANSVWRAVLAPVSAGFGKQKIPAEKATELAIVRAVTHGGIHGMKPGIGATPASIKLAALVCSEQRKALVASHAKQVA